MEVTPEIKQIKTKPAMTKIHCNSKREGLGEDTSNYSSLCPMSYDRQESILLNYHLFHPSTSNPFRLNLAQLPKNWLNFLVLRSATTSKGFWFQNFNKILNFLKRIAASKGYWSQNPNRILNFLRRTIVFKGYWSQNLNFFKS